MVMKQAHLISFAGRGLAVAALLMGGALVYAQTAQAGSAPAAATTAVAQSAAQRAPLLNLQTPAADLTSDAAYSSSSSTNDDVSGTEVAANNLEHLNLVDAMQYGGGRRRYGRPRYRGGNTNADGSPKYDFYVGGGFATPEGDQSDYLTTGWGLQFGGGRMFNKLFGVNLEIGYDEFGMTGTTINNQSELYYDDTAGDTGLGANSHIWSISLQPVVNLHSGEGLGAYVTGGVGFYHKVGNFTIPQEEEECDEFYGCYVFEGNANVDHYTSNAPGFDGGVGLTYKFSRFASERLYAEVRFVHIDNSYRPADYTLDPDGGGYTFTGWNLFPQNSQKTSYIPVKFGLRF
jgi:hypothetical protein